MRTPLPFLIRQWQELMPLRIFFFMLTALLVWSAQAQTYAEREPNNTVSDVLSGGSNPLQTRIFEPGTYSGTVSSGDEDYWLIGFDQSLNFGADNEWFIYLDGDPGTDVLIVNSSGPDPYSGSTTTTLLGSCGTYRFLNSTTTGYTHIWVTATGGGGPVRNYSFNVVAYDATVEASCGATEPRREVMQPCPAPAAPDISVTKLTTNMDLRLDAFAAVPDADGYIVEVSDGSPFASFIGTNGVGLFDDPLQGVTPNTVYGGSGSQIVANLTAPTGVGIDGLSPGVTYTIKVTPYNHCLSMYKMGTPATVFTETCGSPIPAPTGLTVSSTSPGTLNLESIGAVPGGLSVSYITYMSDSPTGFTTPTSLPAANPVYSGSGTQAIHVGTTLTPNQAITGSISGGTTYYFRTYSYLECGGNPYISSAGASTSIEFCGVPNTPTVLSITGTSHSSMNVASISPVTNADGYVVLVNTSNSFTTPADGTSLPTANAVYGGSGEQVVYVGTSSTSNTLVTGLDNSNGGVEYFFKVFAYDNCEGNYYFENTGFATSASTRGAAQTLASNEVFLEVGDAFMDFQSFTGAAGATGHVIKMNTTNSFTAPADGSATLPSASVNYTSGEQVIFAGTSTTPAIRITGLTAATTYHFAIYTYSNIDGQLFYNQTPYAFSQQNVKLTPSITFPDITKTYGDAAFAAGASSNSAGALTYSLVSQTNGGSAVASDGTVTVGNVGTVTIRVDQAANATYNPGTAQATLIINKADPIIQFSPVTVSSGAANQTLIATAQVVGSAASASTGTISFNIEGSAPSGNVLSGANNSIWTPGDAGTLTIRASINSDANYNAGFQDGVFSVAAPATIYLAGPNNVYSLADGSLTSLHALTNGGALGHDAGGVEVINNQLWVTTNKGGNNSKGVISTMNLDGTSPTPRGHYSTTPLSFFFAGPPHVADGKVWVTASSGGSAGAGEIYSLDMDGTNFQVVHTFTGAGLTGPVSDLVAYGGKLYGTAAGGTGASTLGGVYSLTPDGMGGYTYALEFSITTSTEQAPEQGMTLFDNLLWFTTFNNNRLVAYDPMTNTIPHSLSLGEYGLKPIVANNRLFVALESQIMEVQSSGASYVLSPIYTFTGNLRNWGGLTFDGEELVGVGRNVPTNKGFVYKLGLDGTGFQNLFDSPTELFRGNAINDVQRLTPVIDFVDQTVDHLSVTTLNATSNSTGAITYELIGDATSSGLSGDQFTAGNVGTVTVRASVAQDVNFNAATKDVTLTIQKANPTFTISDLTIPFGSSTQTLEPAATNYSGGVVTYQFVDGAGLTVTGPNTGSTIIGGNQLTINNPGNETIRATLPDNSNFNGTTVDFQLTVNNAVADLSGFTDLTASFFQSDVTLSVPSAPGIAVTYQLLTSNTGSRLSGASNSVLTIGNVAGTETIRVTVTEPNYQATTKDITLTVNKATPIVSWNTPAAIQFAIEPLDTDRLNATASVAGTFEYYVGDAFGTLITPGTTTLGAQGAYTLTAVFTPTDTDNYTSAEATVNITATKINLELTIDDKVWVLGQTEPALTYSITNGGIVSTHVLFFPISRAAGTTIGTYAINVDNTVRSPSAMTDDGGFSCPFGLCIYLPAVPFFGDEPRMTQDYNVTIVPGTFTITDKPQISASDVTFNPPTLTYDGTPRAYSVSVATLDPVLPVGDIDLTYEGRNGTVYASSATAPTNAGDYTVTATVNASNLNYGGSVTSDYSIAPVSTVINLTLPPSNFVYNAAPQGVTAPTADDIGGNPTLALVTEYAISGGTLFSATPPTNAGTYTVRVNLATSEINYTAPQASGTFTIDQRAQSITFNAIPEVACGQTSIDLSAYATSSIGATVAFASDNPSVVSIVGNTANILGSGTVNITASQAGDANTSAAVDQMQTLTIAATQENFTVDNPSNVFICNGSPYTLPALTSGDYFSGPGGTGTAYSAGNMISSTTTLYVYGASSVNATCTDENSFTITIESLPVDNLSDVTAVGSYILPGLTNGNYYTGPGKTGSLLTAGSAITSSQTIYIFNEDVALGCTAESSFVVNIPLAPALDFSGDLGTTYDYLEVPDANSLDFTTGMTFEAWVNFEQVNRADDGYDWQFIMGKSLFGESFGLMFLTDPAFPKNLGFWHPGVGDGFTQYLWSSAAANTWYHIAVTVDGTNGTNTYVNGVRVANESGGGALTANALPLRIGANSPGGTTLPYPFQGVMDEVRFWNYARTEAEINSTKDIELAGTETGLVLYYNFNEGTIDGDNTGLTQVTDKTSNGNNATFNSFALTGNTGSNFTDGSGNGVIPGIPQTITFNPIPNVTFGDADFNLGATASSGLMVSYTSSNTGVATISGNTVTIVGAGTTTITASQGGDASHLPASNETQTLTVDPFTTSISINLPGSNLTYAGVEQGISPTANDVSSNPTVALQTEYSVAGANTFSAIAPTNAGSYDVRVNVAASAMNYTAPQVTGTYTIDKAPLTATLDNVSIVYGEAGANTHPTTYTGFVNGETQTVLSIATNWPQANYLDAGNANAFYTVGGPYVGGVTWAADPQSNITSFNYDITFEGGDLTAVTARPVDVTANNRAITYGDDANVGNTVTFEANDELGKRGLANGETATDFTGTVTFSNITQTEVNNYTDAIVPTGGLTNSNYSITYLPGELEIQEATLTVKAQNINRGFGQSNPTVTVFEYSGFQYTDGTDGTTDITGLAGVGGAANGTIAATADAAAAPGSTHAITVDVSGLSSTNYSFAADNTGILTIGTVNQTITFGPLTAVTYGDADFTLGATASSGLAVEYVSSNTAVATVSGNTVTIVGAGTTNITASQPGNTGYNPAPNVVQSLTVDPAAITVTADAGQSKIYGGTDPSFAYTITTGSLVGADALTGDLDRAAGENTGTYAIGQGTLANANYSITFVSNDFAITPKALTALAVVANNKVYDGSDAATLDILEASLMGVESGDMANVALATPMGTFAQTNIGTGIAVTSGLTLTGTAAGNYTLTQPTTLTANIDAKAITVSGVSANNKVYDGTDAATLDINGASLTGVVSGEEANVTLATPTGTFAQTNTGTGLAVTSALTLTGSAAGNYTVTQPTGLTANITALAVTVTPNANQSKAFDGQGVSTDPAISYTHAPALLGSDVFSGALSRVDGSDVGTYAIELGTLSAGTNYALTLDAESFEVTRLAVTVTPDADQNKQYDAMGTATDGPITYTVSPSLVGSDAFTGALTRVEGSNAGIYNILIGDLATTGNYSVTLAPETFEITRRLVIIIASANSKTYDGVGTSTDPVIAYSALPGLIGADEFTGAMTRVDGSNAGSYDILLGTLSAGDNYILGPVNVAVGFGSFQINPLDITITPDASQSRVYDGTDVAGDGTITYGHSPALIGSDVFTGALTRAAGTDAGTYAIELGTLSAGSNYNLSVAAETYTITPLAITVTPDASQSKVFDAQGVETDPLLTYSAAPSLIGSDAFSGALSRVDGSDVGSYAIGSGTLTAGSNYALSLDAETFAITTLAVTVMPDAGQSKEYDAMGTSTDPAITYSVSPSLAGSDAFTGALTRAAGSDAGTYSILIGDLATTGNYAVSLASETFEISPKTIFISASGSGASKIYDGSGTSSDPEITFITPGGPLLGSDTFSGTLTRDEGSDVGNYPVRIGTLTAGSNYNLIGFPNFGFFTINPLDVTITPDANQNRVFDGTDVAGDGTITYTAAPSLIGSDVFTGALTRAAGSAVGTYAIEQGTLSAGSNYNLSVASETYEITKANQSITFGTLSDVSVEAGTFTLSATASSGLGVTFASSDENIATVSGNTVTLVGAGTLNITASQAGDGTYNVAPDVVQPLTVTHGTYERYFVKVHSLYGMTAANQPVLVKTLATAEGQNIEALLKVGNQIWGTAKNGGNNSMGTLFRMDPDGSNFEVLHHFTAGEGNPRNDMVVVGDATVYGISGDYGVYQISVATPGTGLTYYNGYTGAGQFTNGLTYSRGTLWTVDNNTTMIGVSSDFTGHHDMVNVSGFSGTPISDFVIEGYDLIQSDQTVFGSTAFTFFRKASTVRSSENWIWNDAGDALAIENSLSVENLSQRKTIFGDGQFTTPLINGLGTGFGLSIFESPDVNAENADNQILRLTLPQLNGNVGATPLSSLAKPYMNIYDVKDGWVWGLRGDEATGLFEAFSFNRTAGTYQVHDFGSGNLEPGVPNVAFFNFRKTATLVTADQTKAYGTVNPTYTYEIWGLDPGDDATTIGGVTTSSRVMNTPKLNLEVTTSTHPGHYPIMAFADTLNGKYDLRHNYGALTITYAIQPSDLDFSPATASYVYDGTAKAFTSTGKAGTPAGASGISFDQSGSSLAATDFDYTYLASSDGGTTYTVDLSTTAPTNVGKYRVTATVKSTNEVYSGSATFDFEITPKALSVTGVTPNNKMYDGTVAATFDVTGSSLVGVVGSDAVNLATPVGTFDTPDVDLDIGMEANLTLTGADAGNYTLTQPAPLFADITAANVTLPALTAANTPYNGATQSYVAPTVANAIDGGNHALQVEYKQGAGTYSTTAPTNVGLYDIRVSLAASEANFTAMAVELVNGFEITAKSITVTGVTANNKVFDGTDVASLDVESAALVGVETSDVANVTLSSIAGTFAQTDIGTGIAVTPALSLTGSAAANYTLTQPTGLSADITVRNLFILVDNKTKVYGETDPALTYSVDPGSSLVGTDMITGMLTRDAGEGVGTYAITQGTLTAGTNYNLNLFPANLTINQRDITITADDQTKIVAGADPTLTYTITTGVLQFSDAVTGALTRDAGETVGTYAITQGTVALSANYNLTFVPGTLTITDKIPQTITFGALSAVTYGDANFDLTATGGASGNAVTYVSSDVSVATVSGNTVTIVGAGTTTITASQAGDATYAAAADVNQVLTVNQRDITVTADAGQTKVYGDADPTFAYTITTGSLVGMDALTGALDRVAGDNVGTYAIGQGTLANANYNITFVSNDFEIKTRAITVTADVAQAKTYGDPDPTFTYQVTSGALQGLDVLSGALSRAAGEDAGLYAINQGTLASSNYAITFVSNNFIIGSRLLTVTVDPGQSKVYGDTDPSFTYQLTSGALQGSDAFTGTLDRATGEDVGTYAIGIGTLTAGSNYSISFVGDDFNVTARALTITADAGQSKTYGANDPTFTYTLTGTLVGMDALTGALDRVTGENTGTYAINQGTLSAGSNYSVSYVSNDFTIDPLALTITADDQTKIIGGADPSLTYTITSGALQFSDAVTGALTRDVGETVGTYAITQGTVALSANYNLTFVPGTLTITDKIPQTITFGALSAVTYGDANFDLTATGGVSGNPVTYVSSDVSVATVSGNTVTIVGAGTTTITASQTGDATYAAAADVNQVLTVNQRDITVTADAGQTKVYGDTDPTFTYTITTGSLVGMDALTGALDRVAGDNVGTYAIGQGTLANANYNITFVSNDFEITTRAITVTADVAQAKTYGDPDPTFTYQVTSGALQGADVLSGALSRVAGEDAGLYAINQGTLANSNYAITFVSNNFIIGNRILTVTVDPGQTKVYGDTDPSFTYQLTSGVLQGSDAFTGALDRVTGEDVGTYAIGIGTLTAGSNYSITFVSDNFSITAKPLTITADAGQSKTYGASDPTYNYTLTGTLVGMDALTGALDRVAGENAGTYAINQGTLSAGSNYAVSYVSNDFTIAPIALAITADDKTKIQGTANPPFTYTVTSGALINGDMITGSLTVPPSAISVGMYPIQQGTLTAGSNYAITFTDGTFTITDKLLQSITFDPLTAVTYGDASFTLSATGGASGSAVTFSGDNPAVATVTSAGEVTIIGAGTVNITANQAGDATYAAADPVIQNLTVNQAALTITAEDKSSTYGAASLPGLTLNYAGFVNSETESVLTTAPVINTTAMASSNAGTYPITVSGAIAANYAITYVDGTLTVDPAALTITADDKATTYGDAIPTLSLSYAGFVNSEDETVLTTAPAVATTAVSTSNAGSYAITVSGAAASNYTITEVNGTLTIGKATLSVTADDHSRTYGAANPSFALSYAGFIGSDDASVLDTAPSGSSTADATSSVGTYAITASGGVDNNYSFSYSDGTLTVNQAPLSVAADDQSKTYGAANPSMTVTYSGFQNGDDGSSLNTAPTATTTADATSSVGTYAITASGGADDNYTFAYTGGTLTINQAALSVTATDQSKTYGSVNPSLTVTYSGFQNGDDATNLTTEPTVSTSADATSSVGTYAITASGGVDDNYAFTYAAGTLTVNQATLTVTADDQSKTYGAANPSLTVSYSGFVNGDDVTSLTTEPIASTSATSTSSVGTYAIAASGGVDDNYAFTYTDGTLTVNQATLSVAADDQSKTYGASNPSLTLTYSGFQNGEDVTSLTTEPTASTSATSTSSVGTYAITASGGTDDNYTFNYTDGTLTVNQATLSVTADDQSKTYGESNPSLTLTYSGFQNGEDETVLDTAPTASTSATTTSDAGAYSITVSGGTDNNYTFNYTDGTLTINKADQTITFEALADKTVGDAAFDLTATASSGLSVSYTSSDETVATVSGSTVTILSAGTTTITASQVGGTNFNAATDVEQTLTVNPNVQDQTITFEALANQSYGASPFALTAQASSGLAVTYTSSDASVATVSGNTVTIHSVGTTTITASQAGNASYTAAPDVAQTLTVDPATLTVTADDQSKVYGEANPTLTLMYVGFVNGEDATVLDTTPTVATAADASSEVGTYEIAVAGGSGSNYIITPVAGTMTITKATLVATADDQVMRTGDAVPTLTISYSGFVNGDTEADIDIAPSISTTVTSSSASGLYDILLSGGEDNNYELTLINGTLTVETVLGLVLEQSQIMIYPNPVVDKLYIDFPQSLSGEVITVQLFDLEGRKLQSKEVQGYGVELDVKELPEGILILQMSANGEVIRKRIRKD